MARTSNKVYLITHGSVGKDGDPHNVAMAKISAPSPDKALVAFARLYPQRVRTRFPVEVGKEG